MSSHFIITGGASCLARSIDSHWKNISSSSVILCPTRKELDVTDRNAISSYFQQHPCELLICCAGQSDHQLLARTSATQWNQIIDVNLNAAAFCARAAAEHMKEQGRGHIVFISSYSAIHPPLGQPAYAAAKAALIGLAKSLAREWGPHNIRINTILPGWLDTPMTQDISAQRKSEVIAEHTLGRINTPDAVAAFIHTLHTNLPHTSGQVFSLDSRIL